MKDFGNTHVVLPMLMTMAVQLLITPSALAQVTELPKATFREEIFRFPGDIGPPLDVYRPNSDSYSAQQVRSFGNLGVQTQIISNSAKTQSTGIGVPLKKVALTVDGSKFVDGPASDSYPFTHPRASIEYFFSISASPSITSIPLVMPESWLLVATRTGSGDARVTSIVDITSGKGVGILRDEHTAAATPGNGLFSATNTAAINLGFNVNNHAVTGDIYHVSLDIITSMMRGTTGEASSMSVSGFLDPIPELNPIFAAANPDVHIQFSDNLFGIQSAAPEPGSLVLLLLPLTVIASQFRRAGRYQKR